MRYLVLSLLAFMVAIGTYSSSVNAQSDTPDAGDAAQQSADDTATPQGGDQDENQQAAEDEEDSPERVVPTEQISQDLGVSFPVDI